MNKPPDDIARHAKRYTRRYLQRELGCWRRSSRNVASVRAHHLEAQRRRRLRWHLRPVDFYQDLGLHSVAIPHAQAGEVIARNLGNLGATVQCMLNLGRAYKCIGRELESFTVMKAAITLLGPPRTTFTPDMQNMSVE